MILEGETSVFYKVALIVWGDMFRGLLPQTGWPSSKSSWSAFSIH